MTNEQTKPTSRRPVEDRIHRQAACGQPWEPDCLDLGPHLQPIGTDRWVLSFPDTHRLPRLREESGQLPGVPREWIGASLADVNRTIRFVHKQLGMPVVFQVFGERVVLDVARQRRCWYVFHHEAVTVVDGPRGPVLRRTNLRGGGA